MSPLGQLRSRRRSARRRQAPLRRGATAFAFRGRPTTYRPQAPLEALAAVAGADDARRGGAPVGPARPFDPRARPLRPRPRALRAPRSPLPRGASTRSVRESPTAGDEAIGWRKRAVGFALSVRGDDSQEAAAGAARPAVRRLAGTRPYRSRRGRPVSAVRLLRAHGMRILPRHSSARRPLQRQPGITRGLSTDFGSAADGDGIDGPGGRPTLSSCRSPRPRRRQGRQNRRPGRPHPTRSRRSASTEKQCVDAIHALPRSSRDQQRAPSSAHSRGSGALSGVLPCVNPRRRGGGPLCARSDRERRSARPFGARPEREC